MKEIIEKYKRGELMLDEFLRLGLKLKVGDVCRSDVCGNDAQFTVQPFSLSRWNGPEERDNEYKIVNSVQLDKEIAAMEIKEANEEFSGIGSLGGEMKQYKYEKVEYSHAWEVVKLMEEGVELFKTDSDEFQIERINSIALRGQSGYNFYRRTELTQEELEAQKVEELAVVLHKNDMDPDYKRVAWSMLQVESKDCYLSMAKAALEWMKQEG